MGRELRRRTNVVPNAVRPLGMRAGAGVSSLRFLSLFFSGVSDACPHPMGFINTWAFGAPVNHNRAQGAYFSPHSKRSSRRRRGAPPAGGRALRGTGRGRKEVGRLQTGVWKEITILLKAEDGVDPGTSSFRTEARRYKGRAEPGVTHTPLHLLARRFQRQFCGCPQDVG